MPEQDDIRVELKVKRFNPEADTKPHWQTFTVEVRRFRSVVLDALHEAKWHHDGTLTFRRSCAHGVCGSDAMVINGANMLACQALIEDVGTTITRRAHPRPARDQGPASSTWSRSSSSTGR